MSLSSSLNLAYIQDLMQDLDLVRLEGLLKDNYVRRSHEAAGYTVVVFDTTYERTRWKDAGKHPPGDL